MEQNEVSIQEVMVYSALKTHTNWITNAELSKIVGVPDRTVRAKTRKFVNLGICDMAEVFPGHRYRLSSKADKRNVSYVKRLEMAAEVFGIQNETRQENPR